MPAGSGFGSFDPVFRMYEPNELLNLTYLNHAHSDYLEIALEGGVLGLALLIVAIGWATRAGIAACRMDPSELTASSTRFGAGMLLLVALASAVDYPARTPIIMGLMAIGSGLIAQSERAIRRNALRPQVDRV